MTLDEEIITIETVIDNVEKSRVPTDSLTAVAMTTDAIGHLHAAKRALRLAVSLR